ncbi:FecR family protein [Maribacter vaceletii]|uniref:FecR family protein n=1 Tax=Maribacter vaceletii TaxID=1206816 RepID=A0A495E8K4_9FLAO|nr:FecR family protein [Maribacter vaceletii]RKR13275.1 FecR family protein [Maribacter vaceletii]
MKEKEFRKLLEKSINGSLTEQEEIALENFEEEYRIHKNENNFKDEESKNNLKETIWSDINKNIDGSSRSTTKLWKVASVAIIVLGILFFGSKYATQKSDSVELSPKDVITLELEDGTIKVLDEENNTPLFNASGSVVGRQNKNQLVYSDVETKTEKLVYNTLTIPYGRTFELLLSDGTKVYLNAGSSLKYPVKFIKGKERLVYVTGEALLDVSEDKKHPFIVNADNLNVKVFGTVFNVNAYPEDNVTEVVLVEGSVGLYTNETKEGEIDKRLVPGYKASFSKQNKDIKSNAVITDIYTSWMKGELVFRNMIFDNILKKLERQYDVKIINKNKSLSNEKFNASFGSKPPIKEVLDELKITYHLDYEIDGNIIILN